MWDRILCDGSGSSKPHIPYRPVYTMNMGKARSPATAVRLKEVRVRTKEGPPFILENAKVEGLDR